MTLALACYSLAFSLLSAMAFSGGAALPAGYLVEPVCIVVLGRRLHPLRAVCEGRSKALCALSRLVAPVMGLGFACLAALVGQPAIGGGMVVTGYLLFEVLALNDYCNIVKANDASLLLALAFGRLAISAGMLVGWAVGFFADHASFTALAVAGMAIVLVTATLVFTDRDRMPLASIADDRAIREERDMRPSKGTALAKLCSQPQTVEARDRGVWLSHCRPNDFDISQRGSSSPSPPCEPTCTTSTRKPTSTHAWNSWMPSTHSGQKRARPHSR